MKKITPAILAAAMVAGYASAGFAQTQTQPGAGAGVSGSASGKATGVNAGTAEGEGRLAGRSELMLPGAGRDAPVSGAVATQGQAETKKEDNRKRSLTGSAAGAVGAGASTATR